jgi:hypothetical protein
MWGELGGGWGVTVISGGQSPRSLVAVFDPQGEAVYREVSHPQATDLLVDAEVPGRFLAPAGAEIFAYTVDLSR